MPTEKIVAPHGGLNQTWYQYLAGIPAGVASSLGALGTASLKNVGTSGDTVPLLNTANTFSKAQTFEPVILEGGSNVQWDWSEGPIARLNIEENSTLAAPVNKGTKAGTWSVFIRQDSAGNRTLAYAADYLFPFGVDPVLSTDPNALDILICTYDGQSICAALSKSFA